MTDWELGNDILNNLLDEMRGLAKECMETHPDISNMLQMNAMAWGCHVNGLMNDGQVGCPEHKKVTKKFNNFVSESTVLFI